MSSVRNVIGDAAAPRQAHGGFEVAGLRSPQMSMDPYLAIDHFVISRPQFRPHPHAGFSAVTLMFEDSPGSISNRDSTGTHVTLDPGDLHWTQAGSGIVHEEVPSEPPTPCHGAQIFIDLPATVE
jgi:redox-sensitive bicupin YhaK (pirin superfamily)